MYYVYILKSIKFEQTYIGKTSDLKKRLRDHNYGKSTHTKKFRPWKVTWYCAFTKEKTARNFEIYLKTGSGSAFLKKRLL